MPHSNNLCYEFGPYVLNMVQRVLTRSGETISLTPKTTDLLALLVENAGQLLEKEELLKAIWPDTFVEEGNVSQAIFQLRRALGDNRSTPKYIETVTRRGYRFISPVRLLDLELPNKKSRSLVREPGTGLEFPDCPVLAVMPFINSTDQESLEFLAAGISDSIINSLSRLRKLRVMSRAAVLSLRKEVADPQSFGRELGVDAVLIGEIGMCPMGLRIKTELVDVLTGWQVWGEVYDCEPSDVLQVQDEIATELVSALRLALTGEESKRVTARYTDITEAHHLYLEGRNHWRQYTREGIVKAIGFFQSAIEIDPKYSLPYAGIVDCYLRLTTGYLPPDVISRKRRVDSTSDPFIAAPPLAPSTPPNGNPTIELRYEWDWKGAEREVRRADELNFEYPAAHQWRGAFSYCVALYSESRRSSNTDATKLEAERNSGINNLAMLTPNEQVQILCSIAREQVEAGNYEAGCLLLRKWWSKGEWPNLSGLSIYCAGDLLFTAGILAGCLSSTGRIPRGQKLAEALLSGSLGIFVHLGAVRAALESRIELALCYYRQGAFNLSREALVKALEELGQDEYELRGIALIRLAVLERHAGRLDDALSRLSEAEQLLEACGPMATGRYYIERASTLKNLRLGKSEKESYDDVIELFQMAFRDFEAVGHHRYCAVTQNNLGYLLLDLKRFEEAQVHLLYARRLFDEFGDQVRTAQVDDTLARLYLATDELDLANQSSERAVATLEKNDEEALLAEALTTKGLVLFGLNRRGEAKTVLEGAHRIADRCGDPEGAGRALLVIVEEMDKDLNDAERKDLKVKLISLLKGSQQSITKERLISCLELLADKPGVD